MISNKTFIVDKVLDSQNLTLKDSKDEIISLVSSIKEQELDFFVINFFIIRKKISIFHKLLLVHSTS